MVDIDAMRKLKNFYDSDVEIQTCRHRKKMETFRHKCTISWWFMNDLLQLHRLPYFHDDRYMRKLHDMMLKAQDYLSLFRYVAFYYVKDMIAWVLADDGSLPFGVVEIAPTTAVNNSNNNNASPDSMGAFYAVRRNGHFEQELIYECADETINKRCDFYVYDTGAVFVPSGRTFGITRTTVCPVSAFSELIDDKNEIIEAQVCLGDANFMATHPEGFLYSKPLPDTSPENVPEQTRYMEDDMPSAALATSMYRANLSASLANSYVNRFRDTARCMTSQSQDRAALRQMYMLHGGGGGRQVGEDGQEVIPTLYHERQAEFARPSVKETLEHLPSYTEVSRGPPPASLMNPQQLRAQYVDKVAQLMNFPYLLFKPQRGGVTGTDSKAHGVAVSNGNRENAQKQLDDAVCEQQQTFQYIFEELYERTFAHMDRLLFDQLPEQYRALTDHISARMLFDNQITKSDEAIHGLLPFYEAGIVSKDDLRKLLVRNFGLLEEDEQRKRDDEEPVKKSASDRRRTNKEGEKRPSDDDDGDDDDENGKETKTKKSVNNRRRNKERAKRDEGDDEDGEAKTKKTGQKQDDKEKKEEDDETDEDESNRDKKKKTKGKKKKEDEKEDTGKKKRKASEIEK